MIGRLVQTDQSDSEQRELFGLVVKLQKTKLTEAFVLIFSTSSSFFFPPLPASSLRRWLKTVAATRNTVFCWLGRHFFVLNNFSSFFFFKVVLHQQQELVAASSASERALETLTRLICPVM